MDRYRKRKHNTAWQSGSVSELAVISAKSTASFSFSSCVGLGAGELSSVPVVWTNKPTEAFFKQNKRNIPCFVFYEEGSGAPKAPKAFFPL